MVVCIVGWLCLSLVVVVWKFFFDMMVLRYCSVCSVKWNVCICDILSYNNLIFLECFII